MLESIENSMPEDFLSIDLMSAYASLGEIIGEEVSDDFTNPSTGNYNLLITIMLISVLCIGVYTYVDPKKSK